jgi:hypothetical protein
MAAAKIALAQKEHSMFKLLISAHFSISASSKLDVVTHTQGKSSPSLVTTPQSQTFPEVYSTNFLGLFLNPVTLKTMSNIQIIKFLKKIYCYVMIKNI